MFEKRFIFEKWYYYAEVIQTNHPIGDLEQILRIMKKVYDYLLQGIFDLHMLSSKPIGLYYVTAIQLIVDSFSYFFS